MLRPGKLTPLSAECGIDSRGPGECDLNGHYDLSDFASLLCKTMGVGYVLNCECAGYNRMYAALLNEEHHVGNLRLSGIIAVETGKINSRWNFLYGVELFQAIDAAQ